MYSIASKYLRIKMGSNKISLNALVCNMCQMKE